MTRKKIEDLRAWVTQMRGRLGNIKFNEMIALAEQVGRIQKVGSSPPVFVSQLKDRRSLSIHPHPGCMKKGTASAAIKVLEGDIDAWELQLNEGRDPQ